MLTTGDLFRFPDLADALERLAAEGPEWLYRGETARADLRVGHASAGARCRRTTSPPTR